MEVSKRYQSLIDNEPNGYRKRDMYLEYRLSGEIGTPTAKQKVREYNKAVRGKKAVLNRIQKVSQRFQAEHGREPTVTELNDAYREEQRLAQKKSRVNYKGTGGFRGMDEEKAQEIRQKGVKAAQAYWKAKRDAGEV